MLVQRSNGSGELGRDLGLLRLQAGDHRRNRVEVGRHLQALRLDRLGRAGLGAAVARILEHARRRGAAAVAFMDADGEYAPEDVSVLAAPVLAGTADAGVLRTCLLERLERDGSVPRGRLRVLSPQAQSATCRSTSRLYPGWAFAAASGTPPELTRKVLFALLSLPPDANGQAWTVPADYHPVHELFRQLQIGPYAFLRETRWAYLAHRYWPWAAGLAILLVLWGFYTLHVEHLVQRRTRELTAVLAERQSLEERVRSGQQQMEHLSRLSILGELAGTLAHELNQPLAAIGNYARSLLRRQERGKLSDEALRQAAEEIANESERAAGILGGIRSFARKRNIVREARDIADLVGEAKSIIDKMAARDHISLYVTNYGKMWVCETGRCTDKMHIYSKQPFTPEGRRRAICEAAVQMVQG